MAKRKISTAEVAEPIMEQPAKAPGFSLPAISEQSQRYILYGVGAVALLFAGWFAYKQLVVGPQHKEAIGAMWKAQAMFEQDSFKLALENPGGGFDGFLGIIDRYGSSDAGNTAKYYAAICYLQMGDLENAKKYLEDFDAKGTMLPIMKYGILGDIYSDQQDFGKAAKLYEKASNAGKHDLLAGMYLRKLGLMHEHQGNKAEAKKAYERLFREFPNQNSMDWKDVEKYMYRTGEMK
jgi:TolA-binding protein